MEVSFNANEDIPKQLQSGNFALAIQMRHDFIQLQLFHLLASAYWYFVSPRAAMLTEAYFKNTLMIKNLRKEARNLGLLSAEEDKACAKIIQYRNTSGAAHKTIFFDKEVLAGKRKIEEIGDVLKSGAWLSERLSSKNNRITLGVINEMQGPQDNDLNAVLQGRSLQRLQELCNLDPVEALKT